MINYSIIIPHYNRQDLLVRCVDSIPQRDDVEVIIVDDHSDPGKVDFANFPGLHRKNTTCIFSDGKHGKGPGYARNVGLEKAQGKWVIFADSDDYFLPSINELMNEYVDSEKDVLYFKCSKKEADGTFCLSYDYQNEAVDLAIKGDEDQLLYYTPAPWAKFIRREYLVNNKILFQKVTGGDDVIFSIDIAKNTNNREYVNKSMYCVVMVPQSLTRYSGWKSPYNFTIASCSAYTSLLPLQKEKVPYLWICKWWKLLWKSNRWKAVSLIPSLIQTLGMRRALFLVKKTLK